MLMIFRWFRCGGLWCQWNLKWILRLKLYCRSYLSRSWKIWTCAVHRRYVLW